MVKKTESISTQIRIHWSLWELLEKDAAHSFTTKNSVINKIISQHYKKLGVWDESMLLNSLTRKSE